MIGLGTIINSVGIVAGGVAGLFAGKLFRQEQQESLKKACGAAVIFIGIAGAMEGMLKISGSDISSGKSMLVVLCIALGTIIGELIGIEKGFENFGEWLKQKTGNGGDVSFVNAFVTASLTVSIGAMGKGAIFSAIPVFVFEGSITLLAKLFAPIMTSTAIAYLSLIGAVLIFCVGVNIVWGKKFNVANMLPAVILAIVAAYLPWNF